MSYEDGYAFNEITSRKDLMPDDEFHPQLVSDRVKRTSKIVFEAIIKDGVLSKERRRVYEILYQRGPLTGREVNKLLYSPSGHKRLSELKRQDVIDIFGTKTCSVTNREVEAWDVTGRAALPCEEAVTPHPRKAAFSAASKAARLARILRLRPIPGPKEAPKAFLNRYHTWLSAEVSKVLGDIEEESDE